MQLTVLPVASGGGTMVTAQWPYGHGHGHLTTDYKKGAQTAQPLSVRQKPTSRTASELLSCFKNRVQRTSLHYKETRARIMSAYAKAVLLCILGCIIEAANGHALSSKLAHSVENSNLTENANDLSAAQRTLAQMSWRTQWQLLRRQMRDCVKHSKDTSWNCFKRSSLRIFDDLLGARVLLLGEGVRLVRLRDEEAAASEKSFGAYERQDLQHLTWFDRLAMRLAKTLTTHMLQINLQQLTDAYMRSTQNTEEDGKLPQLDEALGTARHRRHRYNVMMTMMFGATALGAVLVPMGFQLLSIVSGKALLLAKMALLLASINGLKRVANNGVHYGLYHVPGEQYNGYNDRGGMHHPRNVPPSIAMVQPFDMAMRK